MITRESIEEMFGLLSGSDRAFIAGNPKTPDYWLEILSDSNDLRIFKEICDNENAPAYILEKMGALEYEFLDEKLAGNPNTPPHVLDRIAQNHNIQTTISVSKNPNTSTDTLKYLLKNGKSLSRKIPQTAFGLIQKNAIYHLVLRSYGIDKFLDLLEETNSST